MSPALTFDSGSDAGSSPRPGSRPGQSAVANTGADSASSSEDELVNKAKKRNKRRKDGSDDGKAKEKYDPHKPDIFAKKRRRLTKEKKAHQTALRPLDKPPPKVFKSSREMRHLGVAGVDAEQKDRIDALRNPELGYQPNIEKHPRLVSRTDGKFGKKPQVAGMGLDVDEDDLAENEEDELDDLFEGSVAGVPLTSSFSANRAAKAGGDLRPRGIDTSTASYAHGTPGVGEWLEDVQSPPIASPSYALAGGVISPFSPQTPFSPFTPLSAGPRDRPTSRSAYGSLSERQSVNLNVPSSEAESRRSIPELEASAKQQAEALRDRFGMKLLVLFSGQLDEEYIMNTEWIPPDASTAHTDEDALFIGHDEEERLARREAAQSLYSELRTTIRNIRERRKDLKPKSKFWTDRPPLPLKKPSSDQEQPSRRRSSAHFGEPAQRPLWQHDTQRTPPSGPRNPGRGRSGGGGYGNRGRGMSNGYGYNPRRHSESHVARGRGVRGGFHPPTFARGGR